MEDPTEDELKKLTSTQLKAFCKDRKIPRYSKAKKAELLQMALDYILAKKTEKPPPNQPTTVGAPAIDTTQSKKKSPLPKPTPVEKATSSTASQPHIIQQSSGSSQQSLSVSQPPVAPKDGPPPVSRQISLLSAPSIATESSQTLSQYSLSSQVPLSQAVRAPSVAVQSASTSAPAFDLPQSGPTATNPPSPKKRKAPLENNPPESKKAKPNAHPKPTVCKPKTVPFKMPNKPISVAPKPLTAIPSASTSSSLLPVMPQPPARKPLISSTKRFTPLVVKKPVPPPAKPVQDTMSLSQQGCSQIYLDFVTTLPASLDNISLPPSLASRKQVPRYALILSQVAEEDLKSCTLVSKMFRYAAYISASYRLLHDFPGHRFGLVLQTYPQNMTNMWPYLRQRRAELTERRLQYEASFLSTAFGGREMIGSQLWMSPDHEKQITVAIRFLLTRLFFCVSVGQSSEWIHGQILDVQQVVHDEIWCITMEQKSSRESFYVLEATCEVVGRVEGSSSKSDDIPVRADWSDYIAHRLLPPTVHTIPPPPLKEQVSWTNHEEYEHGISRHWLKRIRREGSLGAVKEVIAERYILACVVANSLSGQWKSSTEMAQNFAGLDSVPMYSAKPRATKVNLFLPAHHHVESIHFQTQSGATLHPALAIVQTSNREYFILKDNGMQVGSEEEGVAVVWMHLLSCTNSGESL